MKKIDSGKFLDDFIRKNTDTSKDDSILKIESTDVHEILINKKYFYCLENQDIKTIQQRLLDKFLCSIELNNSTTAFRKNYSYLNFLEPHKTGYHFVRLDISSFFHSIPLHVLEETFSVYFKGHLFDDENSISLVDLFLSYVTYSVPEASPNEISCGKKILPMGFITSPTISNIAFRKIDILIQNFCYSHKIIYTRYADDLLFSSPENSKFIHSETFEKEISILVSLLGLKLNIKKTLRKSHTISLNGYTIQNLFSPDILLNETGTIYVSSKKTDIIEQLIYKITIEKKSHLSIMRKFFDFRMKSKYSNKPISNKSLDRSASRQLFSKITGYRSYLISIIVFHNQHSCISSRALKKYSFYVDSLNRIIDSWP